MLPTISRKYWFVILLLALYTIWLIITQMKYLVEFKIRAIENKTEPITVENKTEPITLENKTLPCHNESKVSEDKFQTSCSSSCRANYWTPRVNVTSVSQSKLLSTCSDPKAFYRGQNVVSFTYYDPGGNASKSLVPMYQKSMHQNIVAIRKYYPGFVMRIYTDAPLKGTLCELMCRNPELQWCDIKKTPKFGDLSKMYFRTWRFLPLGDPTVNIVLSRDLDSLISEREFWAMRDWFETKKPISVTRDHQFHDAPILAGKWGANNVLLGDSLATYLQSQIISQSKAPKPDRFYDQHTLYKILWPLRNDSILGYDSYYCGKYRREHEVRPFPVQRKPGVNAMHDDFVGNANLGVTKVRLSPCPAECRPTYGKNWTYC